MSRRSRLREYERPGKYVEPTAWQNFRWDVSDWIGRHMGWLVAIALGAICIYGHNAYAEELYIEAWVDEVEAIPPEGERCYAPYSPDLIKEFENNNVGITVHWYDSVDEFREAMLDMFGEIWDDRQIQAASDCDKQPEFNISYCDIYAVRPTMVDDDTTMSIGHEVLHGLLGAYHD